MPKYRAAWYWDGETVGEVEVEADDAEEAEGVAWERYHQMCNERGDYRVEFIEE